MIVALLQSRSPLAWTLLAAATLVAGCSTAKGETDLDQAIPPFESRDHPLQVVVHDLLETAPRRGAVRVCRALAGKAVRLETGAPLPLGEILEQLAGQVGSDLAPARSAITS
jgi:hypothetical protein